uniref:Uncharacterized protein n=1 Tax=viral metagenome TaxID=1070528 RepID=A0A6H1Z9F4_9ZZZZ
MDLLTSQVQAPAVSLRESGGTVLPLGAVADQSALVRSGASIIGTIYASAHATTTTLGCRLGVNTTAATSGVPVQYSRAVGLGMGAAYDTPAGPSVTEEWAVEVRPVSAATVSSGLHFLRRQDGGAWGVGYSAPVYIGRTVTDYVQTTYNVTSAATLVMYGNYATATGLGTADSLYTSRDAPLVISHKTRTDGANNIVFASVYDRNAASITNAATMRLHSFGWTNNADAYTELASVRCDGAGYFVSMRASGNLGGVASHVTFTNAVEAAAGAATGNYLVVYDGTTKLKLALYADS